MGIWVGLMSGTSVDGIDAVAIEVDAQQQPAGLICHLSVDWPKALQDQLRRLPLAPPTSWLEWLVLDTAVAEHHAEAVHALLRHTALAGSDICGVGFHGQTIFHAPGAANTLQLGSPAHLAAAIDLPVVADFRRADMARGGEGAPLAPLFHQTVFSQPRLTVGVLNLGGIANISVLQDTSLTAGYDTGPANGLMDAWCQEHFDCTYDDQGQRARAGKPLDLLLTALLDDSYFRKPAPKSTGREYFSQDWLARHLSGAEKPEDVLRTLLELTVQSVTKALETHTLDRLVVVGGGTRNQFLLERLRAELDGISVSTSDSQGWPAESVEGAMIAWLAARCHAGMASDCSGITGASSPAVLGALYAATSSPKPLA